MNNKTCYICYQDIAPPVASIPHCSHRFCYKHIEEWLKVEAICPYCRSPIRMIIKTNDPNIKISFGTNPLKLDEQWKVERIENIRIIELDPVGACDPSDLPEIFAARAGKIRTSVVQLKRELIDLESAQNRYNAFLDLLNLYKEMSLVENTFGFRNLIDVFNSDCVQYNIRLVKKQCLDTYEKILKGEIEVEDYYDSEYKNFKDKLEDIISYYFLFVDAKVEILM